MHYYRFVPWDSCPDRLRKQTPATTRSTSQAEESRMCCSLIHPTTTRSPMRTCQTTSMSSTMPATTFAHLDATIVLDRAIAELGI
jgi:hypothetical protein